MKLSLAILTMLASLLPVSAFAVQAGDQAPPWTGVDIAGETYQFPEANGENITVLVFWATWCPYCEAFMPYLATIEKDYAAHGVQVVTINAKERGKGDPKAYMKENGYPFRTIVEGDDIAAAYAVRFIPGLMVIDASGQVLWRRKSTDLPPGKTIAELWDSQVRELLDAAVALSNQQAQR